MLPVAHLGGYTKSAKLINPPTVLHITSEIDEETTSSAAEAVQCAAVSGPIFITKKGVVLTRGHRNPDSPTYLSTSTAGVVT